MKKWFVSLMMVLLSTINPISVVLAEDISSYSYEGDVNDDGLYHGQGKLYYEGQLFYEGDFAYGNFNGKGTLYQVKSDSSVVSDLGKIKYQGHFKNGLYHGDGTLYFNYSFPEEVNSDYHGQQFEGKFNYGNYYGYGTEYNMNGDIKNQGYFINGTFYVYEGPTDENGKMNGNGKLLNDDGQVMFDGVFVHGQIHGSGTMYIDENRTQKYVGEFVYDHMEGKGSIYIDEHLYYQGDFAEGLKQGEGTLFFPDKSISYKGEFLFNRSKEQPFQIKSEVQVDSNLKGTYSVYVVLLDKYKTEATLKHFNDMKNIVTDTFDTIKEINEESEYQGFIATKNMGNIIDSDFKDEFLGFQATAVKTKMMFINQYEIFSRQVFELDPNLMNVNHEILLPKKAKGIQVNGQAKQMDSEEHYVWMNIQGNEYMVSQFQLYNPFTIATTILFAIVLIGGMTYFRKKDKKKNAPQQES